MPWTWREVKLPDDNYEKAARIIARSFYRELKKNGFTENQIIQVATELISCLSGSLDGYKKRVVPEE